MPDAVIHPTSQELAAFGLGKLPERDAAVVAAHLDSCPACRQAVAGVSADSFLAKLRDPKLGESSFASSSAGWSSTPIPAIPGLPPELAHHPKYLILRELGRGGMGVVYQARHKEMERQVVIKVINRALLDRPESLERFRREIRSAAQLSHPNIVAAYDAERAGDSHMLVMEFVPGRNLTEVVQKKGALPISYACHFARQVALGLQHAYERGLVHRDIKPQNLMLTPKGEIKILDFGLAKVVREGNTRTGLTSDNAYLGTPDYCAPEQATDASKADIRADLYSLGCTLYYLLSCRAPFREDTVVKTILAHQQKQPQPLPELRPEVPAKLWQIVARLLAKEPTQRYETPTEVAQALVPFIKSGSKQEAKGSTALPQSTDSPSKGTMFELETSQVKEIRRDVTEKAARADQPQAQAADEAKKQPEAANVWQQLTEGTITSGGQRKNEVIRKPRAAIVRGEKSRKRRLIGGGIGVGVLLLALLGIWIKADRQQTHESSPPESAKKPDAQRVADAGKDDKGAQPPRVNLPADASVDDLRRALKSKNPGVQEEAANRLVGLGPKAEAAMFDLAETLNDTMSPTSVRYKAAIAIAKMKADAKPVVPALAKALQGNQPQEVRMYAAEALAQMKYPANEAALSAILNAIENDNDPLVRQKCVSAIFKLNDLKPSGADKILAKVLDETGVEKMLLRLDTARKLAHALRDKAPDKTADVLLEMLTNKSLKINNGTDLKERDGRVEPQANLGGDARFLVAEALGWLGKKVRDRKDVIDALKAAAKDADPRLRQAATDALEELGVP